MSYRVECPYCEWSSAGMTRQTVKQKRVAHIYDKHEPPLNWEQDVSDVEDIRT